MTCRLTRSRSFRTEYPTSRSSKRITPRRNSASAERPIILTFGLLSPNKGIETMLDAMPEIIKSCPNAVYVILGATHPNLVRDQGEVYRESLAARVRELGIDGSCRLLQPVRRSGHAAGLHFDVRRLCDALSQ